MSRYQVVTNAVGGSIFKFDSPPSADFIFRNCYPGTYEIVDTMYRASPDAVSCRKTIDTIVVPNYRPEQNVDDSEKWHEICRYHNEDLGLTRTTRGMKITRGPGCLIQVSTSRKNPDGSNSLAEALAYIPDASLVISEVQEKSDAI